MNPYIGHESQLYGIEEHRLVGGRGDGMRLLEINNGKGMQLTTPEDDNTISDDGTLDDKKEEYGTIL